MHDVDLGQYEICKKNKQKILLTTFSMRKIRKKNILPIS